MGRLAMLLVLCAAAGCARGPEGTVPASGAAVATDTRPFIAQILRAELSTTPTNTVLTATGLAPVQGYWVGALVQVPTDDPSVLSFAFRAAPPAGPARVSTPRSREVTVGIALSPEILAGIREIRVAGAENALSVRP